ncbi:MAG: DUF5076 domain-containing protein [Proteobacteria bacterium]|nr:DUF5076 domain-containing protein [Pseudomonadota bacterium]
MDVRALPPAALRDPNAVELARVWIAEHGLHCSLRCGLYAERDVVMETTAWGIILADMAGHIADALNGAGFGPRLALFEAVVGSFNVECLAPTSERTGGGGSLVG